VLVTGGTGLVGRGLEAAVRNGKSDTANFDFVYLGHGDGDLMVFGEN